LSETLYEGELGDEQGPSIETARQLYTAAIEVRERQIWELLDDNQIVVAQIEEPFLCSVLGALGLAYSVQCYSGPEGLGYLNTLLESEEAPPLDAVAQQRGVSVEFVKSRELTAPDKAFLKAVGHKAKQGRSPVFRANRPGYHAWYPTESEARDLVGCMRAVLRVCDLIQNDPDLDLWSEQEGYPAVQADGAFTRFMAWAHSKKPLVLPKVNRARVDALRSRSKSESAVDLDYFYGPGRVGGKHERPAWMRIAIAIDSENAFAFPPHIDMPEAETADMLARALLQALEAKPKLPAEVRVRSAEYKQMIEPLAEALDLRVTVKRELPALDYAKRALLDHLGGFT
jgi:hypothetical protein